MSDGFSSFSDAAPAAAAPVPVARAAPAITEVIGEGRAASLATEGAEVIHEGGRGSRALPASTAALLERLDAPAAPGAAAVPPQPPAAPAPPPSRPPPAAGSPAAAPPLPAPAAPADTVQAQLEQLTAERARLVEANRRLVESAEAARAGAPPPTAAMLDELAGEYGRDTAGAIRKVVARFLGVDDPAHPDVDAELAGLTTDLTSHVHKVSMDPSQQALRNTAQTRILLAHDKKTRKAESETAAKEAQAKAEADKASQAVSFIGNRLSAVQPDGSTIKQVAPLAATLIPKLTGRSFEEEILVTQRQLRDAGVLDPARLHDDDYIVKATAIYLESQAKAHVDLVDAARPQPSTATTTTTPPAPAPAASTSASQAPPHSHGGRSLTQADSSAAPAVPPSVPTPDQPTKNMKTRRDVLSRYFPE